MTGNSEAYAKQLAKDITEKYPATVFGMAKGLKYPASSKVTALRVKSITHDECKISLVTCSGEICEMNDEVYKFNPPLQSITEMSTRMPQIRDAVLTPNPLWLLTDPLALVILLTCASLGYGTLLLGTDGIIDGLANVPRLEGGISAIFGSTGTFANLVVGSFWFSIVAHGIEASIALRHSLKSLQLGSVPTVMWSSMVFLVGYPMFSRFQKIVTVQEEYGTKSK
ncbi:unnamed protein product [Cylindrotheca closterium]|uniref:DUF2470 domain-containing protein n=1 Tax=Cylindrotheca closterium TaxID=2856 RepID=A0AAD2CX55_9STRA|nr:unnamed protein product [Cylindrotheca closterium]